MFGIGIAILKISYQISNKLQLFRYKVQQLFVTENTVKTHLKKIFAKLKVTNRTLAIEKAREIGLIS